MVEKNTQFQTPSRYSLFRRLAGLTVCAPLLLGGPAYSYDGQCTSLADVNELPPGHWCEVPNSHMRGAEKKPSEWPDWDGSSSASYDSFQRSNGVQAVINNWGGGTFDSRRDRLLIKGGGHNGYGGNEVYAFELRNLRWTRITDPTPFPTRCGSVNSDGTPVSRHTYSGLSYIEQTDEFFVLGGAPDCENGGAGVPGTWLLDLSQLESDGVYSPSHWRRGSSSGEPQTRAEDEAVYDPVSGKVFYQFGPSPSGLSAYHSVSNTWAQHSAAGLNPGATMVIPGNRRFIVHLGGELANGYTRWGDLDSESISKSTVGTSGAKNMESADNPGAAYDWQSDRIVSWSGGTTVYALDVDTNVWQVHNAASSNLANPGSQDAVGGTYGRFVYSRSLNVFVTVDSVDENVFIYRLSPGAGTDPDAAPNPPVLDTP